MAGIFKLDIDCPACGKTSHQSIVRLRSYKRFRCMGCGQMVRTSGEDVVRLDAAIAEFEKETAKVTFFVGSNGLTPKN